MLSKVKAFLFVFALVLSGHAALAASSNLGLLANYYHDCPASHGPDAAHLRNVIRHALGGDEAAMPSLIMHKGIFSTGDNEGYGEIPDALLRTLGDVRYAAFVSSQSAEVRHTALGLVAAQTENFARAYPRTAKLYQRWISSQRHTSGYTLPSTTGE